MPRALSANSALGSPSLMQVLVRRPGGAADEAGEHGELDTIGGGNERSMRGPQPTQRVPHLLILAASEPGPPPSLHFPLPTSQQVLEQTVPEGVPAGGGGGDRGTRGSQPTKSVPYAHIGNSKPGPPSSSHVVGQSTEGEGGTSAPSKVLAVACSARRPRTAATSRKLRRKRPPRIGSKDRIWGTERHRWAFWSAKGVCPKAETTQRRRARQNRHVIVSEITHSHTFTFIQALHTPKAGPAQGRFKRATCPMCGPVSSVSK